MNLGQFLHVAVVGGGVAGYTTAILLAAAGVGVDLLEARETTEAESGIMLQANALRVLRTAGVLTAVQKAGFGCNSTGIRLPDSRGTLIAQRRPLRIGPARGRRHQPGPAH